MCTADVVCAGVRERKRESDDSNLPMEVDKIGRMKISTSTLSSLSKHESGFRWFMEQCP